MDLGNVSDLVDWHYLERELGEQLVAALRDFANGAEADIREYGLSMAFHTIAAIRQGDEAIKSELLDQAKALKEINRIRMNEFAENAFGVVLATAFRIGLAALKAA
jgi:hypothetical protein